MSDGLSFATAVDTSGFEEGMQRIEDGIRDAASNIEGQSERIQSLFNDVPKIDIEFITNMPETADQIEEAYSEIDRVTRINREAIAELTQEYNRLSWEINKYQNAPQKRDEVAKWKQEKQAISENIRLRQDLLKKVQELTKVVDANEKAFAKSHNTQNTVKQRIKEIMAEMANLRNEAQLQGKVLDESTGRYRALAEELGRLKDIQVDVATQAKILSNDESQFQGIISGVTGLSGAFSAAHGAMALFGAENENLQKVMTQLQAVMAITIGLQQVQQMLNKDSAFRLVTLNSLRNMWNKLIGESNTLQAVNNAETQTSVAVTESQAAATEHETAAEEANTSAQAANNSATQAGTAGRIAGTTATKAATATQHAHTGAVVTGTIATKAMTVATKALKIALISTGIGALVVAVGELVAWITKLVTSEDEATKHAQAMSDINKEANKTYMEQKVKLEDNIKACKNFKGSKEQEKKMVEGLNSEYGSALGYYESVAEWEQVLINRGAKYLELLRLKAVRQGVLNAYVNAYVDMLDMKSRAERGDFDRSWINPARWFGHSNRWRRNNAETQIDEVKDAVENMKRFEKELAEMDATIAAFEKETNFDEIHIDPKTGGKKGGGGGKSFDPKEAARQRKEALKQYEEAVKQFIKETNDNITQANLDAMEDGLQKELRAIQNKAREEEEAFRQIYLKLAQEAQALEKAYFLSRKGNTLEGWEASARGKMTTEDYMNEYLTDPKNADAAKAYYDRLKQITEQEEKNLIKTRQKYESQWIQQYGSNRQKEELLQRQWSERLNKIALEAPELLPQAMDAMEKEFRNLDFSNFKDLINWEDIFGNLADQSLASLQYTLDKIKTYFNQVKDSLSVEEIKTYQNAISEMENEIASRNPFTALHKSMKDISSSKSELVAALAEMTAAQNELNEATAERRKIWAQKNALLDIQDTSKQTQEMFNLTNAQETLTQKEREYAAALSYRKQLEAQIAAGDNTPETAQLLADAVNELTAAEIARNEALQARNEAYAAITDQEVADATLRLITINNQLEASENRVASARQATAAAENMVLTARNNVTKSYKQFAAALKNAGGVLTDLGSKARNLAQIFSNDVANSIEKALDCIDEVLDATSSVIDAIGDVGKSVAKGVEQTVDAVGAASTASAQAAKESISMVEKASLILTVVSATLQAATAIAKLFNDDDEKQKEIEHLQNRIDQLQWELNNQDAMRLQRNTGIDAVKLVRDTYNEAYDMAMKMNQENRNELNATNSIYNSVLSVAQKMSQQESIHSSLLQRKLAQAAAYRVAVEQIAAEYAKMSYTANKALGTEKYKNANAQLKNMAEQQVLLQKQIDEESKKKDSDSGKIKEYKQKIQELANDMVEIINAMLEDIIGMSADNLAKTLGDAFFDAVKRGEDAMEAWAKTTKELVADILKRMMINEFLEGRIGEIFDTYKSKWFKDGEFQGADAVLNSADDFAYEIQKAGEEFQEFWETWQDALGGWFDDDAEREGTSRGIATASQESVDENNARLTTIQGHTYNIMQGLQELNGTANAILERVTGIEANTSETNERLNEIDKKTKRVADTLETIQTSGLKLK